MSKYKVYRKKAVQLMRPYVEGEDLRGVAISAVDTPGPGGMIAISSQDENDRWYVSAQFFQDNYEPA